MIMALKGFFSGGHLKKAGWKISGNGKKQVKSKA